jgi:hypothetical protein
MHVESRNDQPQGNSSDIHIVTLGSYSQLSFGGSDPIEEDVVTSYWILEPPFSGELYQYDSNTIIGDRIQALDRVTDSQHRIWYFLNTSDANKSSVDIASANSQYVLQETLVFAAKDLDFDPSEPKETTANLWPATATIQVCI